MHQFVLALTGLGRVGMGANCEHAAEPVDGPAVASVRALAKEHAMNVVLPLHESRDGKVQLPRPACLGA